MTVRVWVRVRVRAGAMVTVRVWVRVRTRARVKVRARVWVRVKVKFATNANARDVARRWNPAVEEQVRERVNS